MPREIRFFIRKKVRTIEGESIQTMADDGHWYIALNTHGFATRETAGLFWRLKNDGSRGVYIEDTRGKKYNV